MIKLILSAVAAAMVMPLVHAQEEDPFDRDRAIRVLQSIGADLDGASAGCRGCHDPNMIKISKWAEQAFITVYMCLTARDELPEGFAADSRWSGQTASSKIDCMKKDSDDPSSAYDVPRLGLLTAGAHTNYFLNMFVEAYGEEQGPAKHAEFVEQVGMPKHDDKMSEEQFADLKDWFTHPEPMQPYLEELLGAPVDTPRECTSWRSSAFDEYLADRQLENWTRRNLERGIKMFGCPPEAVDPQVCFTDRFDYGDLYPRLDSTHWGRTWSSMEGQSLRVLYELPFETSFWMRSSADGRFVANGVNKFTSGEMSELEQDTDNGGGDEPEDGDGEDEDDEEEDDTQELHGMITDLLASKRSGAMRTNISVRASYDPTFFPDNSGFLFQGAGNGFCQQTVLTDPLVEDIDFSQPGCSVSSEISLYQSVGVSLDGTDYFAVTGTFASDSGTSPVGEPEWLLKSYLDVNPILFNGDIFEAQPATRIWAPFLGDFGLSPSTNLTIARVAGLNADDDFVQLGYDVSRLNLVEGERGVLEVSLTPMARICHSGAKANFSFDERFVVTHRPVQEGDYEEFGYPSAYDEEFVPLIGSHNVYLFDLVTGNERRLTTVGANQHAKFPHFRSDGWIYFLALSDGRSYVVASDGALKASKGIN